MIYTFPYEWADSVDTDAFSPCSVYQAPPILHSDSRDLETCLEEPIGTPPLSSLLRDFASKRILVLVDDITRPTPQHLLVPKLLDNVQRAGVPLEHVTILVCTGLHRVLKTHEFVQRLGRDIVDRVKVISHDAYDPDSLFLFDATEKGIPIRLNRLVREADFIIAVGTLEPHRIAGFSGGAKMVLPGICGEEIVADTHWQAWLEEGPNVYGKIDTPMRQLMESVADRVGLKFIVNTILDETGHILRYFVGDPRRAFRAGCQEVERLFAVPVRSADIVIADSYPFDIDLWQACKAVSVAELVLRRNGTIILVTPCPEGLSRHDSRIRKFGYLKKSEIVSRVADGSIDDLATACHLMSLGRILEQGQLIIVSNGLGPELLGQVGLQGARCVDDAIGIARERLGKGAEVCILKHPCAFLPKAA